MNYSQNNEQQIIGRYFGRFAGVALDIGANDGITISNTYALWDRGWKGALVEPSPQAFDRLRKNLAEFVVTQAVDLYNRAVGVKDEQMILHDCGTHLKKNDVALLSTLVESERDKWAAAGNEFEPVRVDVLTWNTLQGMMRWKHFDLVSIDAEGMDLEILRQMDLSAMAVQMLVIEHEHCDREGIIAHCDQHGMKLHAANHQNSIFVR